MLCVSPCASVHVSVSVIMWIQWVEDNSTFHSTIPEAADLVVASIYTLFGVCSLLGNGMLLYVSYEKRPELKPAEFFIINLAVSDLGMTLSLYPLAVTSSIYHRWLYGEAVCLLYAFCGVLFGICSLSTLTALSTVCCLKVCYPLYGKRLSPAHSRLLIGCCWAYALLFACSPLLHWGAYGPEPYGTACCIDWRRSRREAGARSYTLALLLLCYAAPCCVMLLSYGHILLTVRESRRAVEQHAVPATTRRTGSLHAVILKLSVAVCIGFLLAWSPYALVSMLATYGHVESLPPMAFAVPAVFAKSSTLYNPLIYLLLKPNYRHLLSQHLLAQRKKCPRLLCPPRLPLCSFRGSFSDPAPPCSDSAPPCSDSVPQAQATLGPSHCDCGQCADTFECFKHYPRCCHGNVKASQPVPGGRSGGPGVSRGPRPGGGWVPGAGLAPVQAGFSTNRKRVGVTFCDKKNIQQESELPLETVSK
ncbi:opsin 7, group member a isoform X2 [Gadus morhua]|uniref:opsin 7, group member a isoform X2 n=1 Tax=Gadus morhua TaxID=8049 RepID=UPI0011B45E72|nr:opsin-5-like isoform X2 [Gadus morhua]XP_030227961.1 opsin-5-like isoform X2 [Gadus morhua]XP_030227962.1 opsin-5-like isoform X2 [Gadus morhua]